MRTKTLLLTAALVAAGVATSMAQSNVYSQNIVGYVNLTIKQGYNLITLPLLGADPLSQINNVLTNTSVVGNLQASSVFFWNPSTGTFNPNSLQAGGDGNWYDQSFNLATNQVPPGLGFFLQNGEGSNYTVTIVGTVLTGTNSYPQNAGFGFYGLLEPLSGDVTTNGFPMLDGGAILQWSSTAQTYINEYLALGTDDSSYDGSGNLTGNPAPFPVLSLDDFNTRAVYTPAIGEGFIYITGFNPNLPGSPANPPGTYTSIFNVQ